MTWTLKNRPRRREDTDYEMLEWFEGFEKQEREALDHSKDKIKLLILKEKFIVGSDTSIERWLERGYQEAIKEILGGSEPPRRGKNETERKTHEKNLQPEA